MKKLSALTLAIKASLMLAAQAIPVPVHQGQLLADGQVIAGSQLSAGTHSKPAKFDGAGNIGSVDKNGNNDGISAAHEGVDEYNGSFHEGDTVGNLDGSYKVCSSTPPVIPVNQRCIMLYVELF